MVSSCPTLNELTCPSGTRLVSREAGTGAVGRVQRSGRGIMPSLRIREVFEKREHPGWDSKEAHDFPGENKKFGEGQSGPGEQQLDGPTELCSLRLQHRVSLSY